MSNLSRQNRDTELSIVIPNARSFPNRLIDSLLLQLSQEDEILVVKNHFEQARKYWSDLPDLSLIRDASADILTASSDKLVLLNSTLGAAAARNRGWRSAKNQNILFLDDDVLVQDDFLKCVKLFVQQNASSGVITFRVKDHTLDQVTYFSRVLSLDRGSYCHYSCNKAIRLEDTWMYGVGAALFAKKEVLELIGGFKDELGAGLKNGGVEDTELICHASHHTPVIYCGEISVFHPLPKDFRKAAKKQLQYCCAVAFLGALYKNADGFYYMFNCFLHVIKSTGYYNQKVSTLLQTRILCEIIKTSVIMLRVYISTFLSNKLHQIFYKKCRERY